MGRLPPVEDWRANAIGGLGMLLVLVVICSFAWWMITEFVPGMASTIWHAIVWTVLVIGEVLR